jgi:hypothetical protein
MACDRVAEPRCYSTLLSRVIGADYAVFSELDPEPMPPVALDHTWGAITGLTANISGLGNIMEQVPPECWTRQGLLRGSPVSAIELANYGVHKAVHHLLDLELVVDAYLLRTAVTGASG